jgi:pSer/pThr/pTyr-binding forkhead associated (FHA) protein
MGNSLQLVIENPSSGEIKVRLLHQPFAVIGRNSRADVVLDHAQVSRRHVYVQIVEGRAFWVDLESRTGTRSQTGPQKSGWLEGRQTLGVGPYVIRRLEGDSPTNGASTEGKLPRETPLFALAYSPGLLPEVALEFLNGPSRSRSWPVHRAMSLIGSAAGCKFRLTDPSVSRFHGSLLRTSAGLWIVDLLGHGGITVNGVPVRAGQLSDGDVLAIGRYRIRMHCRLQGQRTRDGSLDLNDAAMAGKLPPEDLGLPDWAAASVESATTGAKGTQISLPRPAGCPSPEVGTMPSDDTLPVKLAQSGLADPVLVPLVNQFGLMQQQMFDQFQQAMAMMVRMFGTMHRDQMEVIRAELEGLRELTEEFHALQQELANQSRKEAETPSSELLGASAGAGRSAVAEPGAWATAAKAPAAAGSKPSNGLGPARDNPEAAVPPPSWIPSSLGHRSSEEPRLFPSPSLSDLLAASTPERPQEASSRSETRCAGASAAADSDRHTVVWLHERIMSLQREREGRWQKILKLLPGMC